ncbi:MAG: polysaccharide biosynthesis/export family protein [Desulfosarcinaceae bacterium]|nr:polysaccharide biosynthesis/export family protein [Desulfosarcinaceae bacterium]
MKRGSSKLRGLLPALLILTVPLVAITTVMVSEGAAASVKAREVGPATGALLQPPDYQIGPGDVLEISVWKDQALSRQVVVLPDGRIDFPLVGHFLAMGRTTQDLKIEMEEKLRRFIPEPILTVIVTQVNSMRVYVIGKVNRPGQLVLPSNVNVMQALAMAGGLNTFAKANDIRVFREVDDRTVMYPFAYERVSEGKQLEQNIVLQRGDVIVVP